MTVITMSNYIFNTNTDIYSKLVYAAIKKFSDSEGKCFPSRNTLAELCGISLSTLRKAINTLVEAHVLDKKFRYRENRSQTSNLYTIAPFMLPRDYYYFKVRADIFELDLNLKETIVYMYLCSCANKENECHPSMKQIAAACGISLTSAKSAIKELTEGNFIIKINQFRDDGGRRNNLYKIITEENVKESDILPRPDYAAAAHEQDELSNMNENKETIQETESDHGAQNNKSDIDVKKERKGMDVKIRGDIFNFKLPKRTILVYLYLCTHTEPKTGKLPPIQQIAHGCKISNAKAEKIILELKNARLIEEVQHGNSEDHTMVNTKPPPWVEKNTP